jgi:tyrosine-protein kinase Etk/Wzc
MSRMPIEAQEAAAEITQPPPRALPVLVRVAFRRSRLVWRTALAIALGGTALALLLPRRYTATVTIMPPQQGSSSSGAMLAQISNLGALASMGGSLGIKNPNDLQVSLLKSRTLEDAMVERFNLQTLYGARYLSTARKRWERKTVVDNGLRDGLIRLSVTDGDPKRAAELANGWVEEYQRLTASLAETEASQRRLFFERELEVAHADLTRAEDNLKETEQRTGVLEMDGQAREMIASAAALRAQVAAKEVEIRGMRQFAAGGNPDLVRAEQELSGMEDQLATMDADSDRREGNLAMPKGRITQDGLEYVRAVREMKYREAVYELMTREVEVARVDEARQGALVQVVDPALVPDRPSSVSRIWIIAAALLGALPLALLTARAVDFATFMRSARRQAGSWEGVLAAAWARRGDDIEPGAEW